MQAQTCYFDFLSPIMLIIIVLSSQDSACEKWQECQFMEKTLNPFAEDSEGSLKLNENTRAEMLPASATHV